MKSENDRSDGPPAGQEPAAGKAPDEAGASTPVGVLSTVVGKIQKQSFLLVIGIAIVALLMWLGGVDRTGIWITVGILSVLAFAVILVERRPKGSVTPVPFPDSVFGDGRVEEVKKSLNRLHAEYVRPVPPSEVLPVLKRLFANRNTFTEKVSDCNDENWADRFVAAVETQRLLDEYLPYIQQHAKSADQLVRAVSSLRLHQYVQHLTGLFEPVPRAGDVKDGLRRAGEAKTEDLRARRFEEVKQRLRADEIRPETGSSRRSRSRATSTRPR